MEGLIKDLKNILSKKKRIAITTHTNPDGDAIGSSLALFLLIKKKTIEKCDAYLDIMLEKMNMVDGETFGKYKTEIS